MIEQKQSYMDALKSLLTHCLLKLHLDIADSTRYVPVQARNAILVKLLKEKLSLPEFKKNKADLKRLIFLGRGQNSLEQKLFELYKELVDYSSDDTDAKLFYILIQKLEIKLGVTFVHIKKMADLTVDHCYMDRQNLEKGFDDYGEQLAAIRLYCHKTHTNDLFSEINNDGTFVAVLAPDGTLEGDCLLINKVKSCLPNPTS
jgi:hypothetical protein